jgi:hypothetical protein
MNLIIDGEKIDSEDYSGASIYLNACFPGSARCSTG